MILYFTGTGNSRHLAAMLPQLIGDEDIMDMTSMIKSGQTGDFHSEKPFIFVMPTYAWRMPRIASEFIERSSFSGTDRAYFILTCGSSSGNAAKYAARLCRDKGFDFCGCIGIRMPENYVAMFSVPDEETSARLIGAAERSLRAAAAKISAGEKLMQKSSLLGAIESSIVNVLFYKFAVNAKGFRTTDGCTGCGLCRQVCPTNNIAIVNGRPKWSDNCTHCMACICRCPAEAIEYGRASVGKRRYYLDD